MFLFVGKSVAHAKNIAIESEDLITAPRIEPFSERSGLWPHHESQSTQELDGHSNWWSRILGQPGIDSRQEGIPAISVRGSVKSDRTLLLLNGIPLNLSDGMGPSGLLIPEEIVGSSDFIRGPASAFYGRSALGGVINNRTEIHSHPKIQMSTDSLGLTTTQGILPYPFRGQGRGQVSVMRQIDNGNYPFTVLSNGVTGTRLHNDKQINRYTLSNETSLKKWKVKQIALYAEKKGNYPARIDSPTTSLTPPSGLIDNQIGLFGLSLNRELNSMSSFVWNLSGIRSDQKYDLDMPSFSATRTDRIFQSFQFSTISNSTWASQVFFDQYYDEYQASYLSEGPFHSTEIEGGGTLQIPISSELSIQPGVRYSEKFKKLTSSFGVFQNTNTLSKWITFSQGYRNPTLVDRYCQNSFCLGNPNLQPEESEQLEVGYATKAEPTVLFPDWSLDHSISIFRTFHQNYFEYEFVEGKYRTENRSGAVVFGAEGLINLSTAFQMTTLSFTYLESENLDSKRSLNLVPKFLGTIETKVSLAQGWQGWAKLTYIGSYPDQLNSSSPVVDLGNTYLVDLGAVWHHKGWNASVSGLNILDKPIERQVGYPERQVSILAKLSWEIM
ncbi:MAG: TonB-dependent receptor [Bdellovibrionales bacterium]|nr:TonB-dependent receptor [Bdellovibrionales bacterium]